jgi:uncharacterized Zn finger protein
VSTTHPAFAARRGPTRLTSWWGKAWLRAVEEAAFNETDLRTARALARAGEVGGITGAPGSLVASVGDARGRSTASCGVPVLEPAAVDALVEVVAAETGRIGALLAGDLPHDLVEHAEETGVELLPTGHDVEASCTCDAWLDPCPHALAVLLQTGWLLEADPFVLLALRGVPRDDLVARLHTHRPVRRDPDGDGDAALDAAVDAAVRAARVLELLDAGESRVEHLL